MGSRHSQEMRLLRALAKPGRQLVPLSPRNPVGVNSERWGEGGRIVETPQKREAVSSRGGPGGEGTAFDGPVCANCDAAGWIVPDQVDDGWRLSNAGRIQIRRGLSRSEVSCSGAAGEDRQPGAGEKAYERQAIGSAGGDRGGVRRPRASSSLGEASPLGWLKRRKGPDGRAFLSDEECDAGERLQRDFTMGQMSARVTARLDAFSGSTRQGVWQDGELSLDERACDARERFRSALKAVGPELADILLDVCCLEKGLEDIERSKGWPRRSGKVVVQMGLRALARHYRAARTLQREAAVAS